MLITCSSPLIFIYLPPPTSKLPLLRCESAKGKFFKKNKNFHVRIVLFLSNILQYHCHIE